MGVGSWDFEVRSFTNDDVRTFRTCSDAMNFGMTRRELRDSKASSIEIGIGDELLSRNPQ